MNSIVTLATSLAPQPDCNNQILAHQATYALRIAIVDKLNSLQALECAALEKLKNCSTTNTEHILNILKQWLSDGYLSASQMDIDEVDRLSDIKHGRWCELGRNRELAEARLLDSNVKLAAAKETCGALDPGLLGRLKLTKEEKERLKAAEAYVKSCDGQVKSMQSELDDIDSGIQDEGRKFIESCCKSMALVSTDSDLGRRLSKAVADSKRKIADVWTEHCQNQNEGLSKVGEYISNLNSFYRVGE